MMQKKHTLAVRAKAVFYNSLHRMLWNLAKNDLADLLLIFMRHRLKKEGGRLRFYHVDGVKHYAQEHGGDIRVVEGKKARSVCIPAYFEGHGKKVRQYQSDEIYLAKIKHVDLVGGSDLLLAGRVFLSDVLYSDKENRVDIRYGPVKKVWKNKVLATGPVSCQNAQKAVALIGAASFNYYHLLVEILARLAFVDQCEAYRTYPVLVDACVLKVPQYFDALRYLNRYNHKIIAVEKGQKWHIRELIYPSRVVWMPVNVKNRKDIVPGDFMVAATALASIRKCVPLYDKKPPWRKIFVSRRNTGAIRLANEASICAIFKRHGFEVIYTEEMSFAQQVTCFGQAKWIVAASGAALANIVFCQKGARVGCILPSCHHFYLYSTMAYLLGLVPVFLDADIIERTQSMASDRFWLDEAYAKRYAQSITDAGREGCWRDGGVTSDSIRQGMREVCMERISKTAVVHEGAHIGEGVILHDYVVIYPNVVILPGAEIFDHCVVGKMPKSPGCTAREIPKNLPDTVIGENTVLSVGCAVYAGTSIGHHTLLGDYCSIREECEVGSYCIISRNVSINYHTKIGDRTKIMDNSHITGNAVIEEDVFISALVVTTNDNAMGKKGYGQSRITGPYIKSGAAIGAGANLLPHVVIGKNCVVGAGALVTKDVPDHKVVMGIPARIVRDAD